MDIRDRARLYLLQLPPIPAQITSNGFTAALFHRLSGLTHQQLLESWGLAPRAGTDPPVVRADPGPGLTSCNGFVANYGSEGGIAIVHGQRSVGQFDLEKKLQGWKKGFAWVPSTPGARPKFGDIFEVAPRLHQGVSLDFDGNVWNTAEGGQGGKRQQPPHDIIMRKRTTQTSDVMMTEKGEPLKGWIDIDLFFNGPPPTALPAWLLGWWAVPWRDRTFYYFFEANFRASWTYTKPMSDALAPFGVGDTATVMLSGSESIIVTWAKTGSVEKFNAEPIVRMMSGMWNDSEPLIASKMF